MITTVWLAVNQRGSANATKRRPNLRAGEVAIRLTIEVDDRHFRMPTADAHLAIGEDMLVEPEVEVTLEDPDAQA